MGVTTLELDVGVTVDGVVVVNHDRHVNRKLYLDTQPATTGDRLFPYAGRKISELTQAQIMTLDLRRRGMARRSRDEDLCHPTTPSRMPTLEEVFALCHRSGAGHVRLNVEAKRDPTRPTDTADPARFAERILTVVEAAGRPGITMLSCFDWSVLVSARNLTEGLPLVALVPHHRKGPGSVSPVWTAGIDVSSRPFFGDVAAAVASFGASVLAPNWRDVTDSLIRSAHREGLRVIPWTVNDSGTMARLIELGVDGIITDHPQRLRTVMEQKRLRRSGVLIPS
jgi:glycerophosphoryl diester phosphodiesterase